MTHSSSDFADHMLTLLKNTGPTGPTGHTLDKTLTNIEKTGTSRCNKLGPVVFDWSHHGAVTGPSKRTQHQRLERPVTSGTSGTTNFAGGDGETKAADTTPEWHAILVELTQRKCPDWMPLDRWDLLLRDGSAFLNKWAQQATELGWTSLDLFGVHPLAPAARFGAMGLLLITNGSAVTAISAESAGLRTKTGAIQTYRRKPTSNSAILLTAMCGR